MWLYLPLEDIDLIRAECERLDLPVSRLIRVVMVGSIKRGQVEALMRRYPELLEGTRRMARRYNEQAMWSSTKRGQLWTRSTGHKLTKHGYRPNAPKSWAQDKAKWWHLTGPGISKPIPCAYEANEAKRIAGEVIRQADSQGTGDNDGRSRGRKRR